MSLAPRERQALAEIENQLHRSDPRLAALFTRWNIRGVRWRSAIASLWWHVSGHGKPARLALVGALATLAVGLAVVGVLTTSAAGPTGRSLYPAGRQYPAAAHPTPRLLQGHPRA